MARIGKLELVLLLALASPAQGQPGPVDQGMFRYFQGGGEIGRETFRAEPRRFESTVVIPLLGARLVSLWCGATTAVWRATRRGYCT